MTTASESFHHRFLVQVAQIERHFPVAHWTCGDVHVWPLARTALYLDMYWRFARVARPRQHNLPLRMAGALAMPLRNLWRSRRQSAHVLWRPSAGATVFLGDGVSLDRVGEHWRDRFCEPLMAALQAHGREFFLMQGGLLSRLPWQRPAFPANVVGARGLWRAALATGPRALLPDHAGVLAYLAGNGEDAPSLSRAALERAARTVCATAGGFERLLRVANPKLAFVVNYYSGLGPAFVLACRRLGILSVDLQHCPQEGAHMAYGWSTLPPEGYSILPAVFWNWTRADANYIDAWARGLSRPWHRSFHGGHPQLAPFLDDREGVTQVWDKRFRALGGGAKFGREILVALQPLHGQREVWQSLATQIAKSPPQWRWWIRRHPAATVQQDAEYAALLSLRQPNVVIDEASAMPLPALLRHVSVLVSLKSGAAAEAALFGVPAVFLHADARAQFATLFERNQAFVVSPASLLSRINVLPAVPARPAPPPRLDIWDSLRRLEEMAAEYAESCERDSTVPAWSAAR